LWAIESTNNEVVPQDLVKFCLKPTSRIVSF
jgi:hypothetical protein